MKRKDGNNNGHTGGNPRVDEELLTVEQVAENWQVSQRMIRRMIADGRLPVVRIGRVVRISAKTRHVKPVTRREPPRNVLLNLCT